VQAELCNGPAPRGNHGEPAVSNLRLTHSSQIGLVSKAKRVRRQQTAG
jgi:hypothetical protein